MQDHSFSGTQDDTLWAQLGTQMDWNQQIEATQEWRDVSPTTQGPIHSFMTPTGPTALHLDTSINFDLSGHDSIMDQPNNALGLSNLECTVEKAPSESSQSDYSGTWTQDEIWDLIHQYLHATLPRLQEIFSAPQDTQMTQLEAQIQAVHVTSYDRVRSMQLELDSLKERVQYLYLERINTPPFPSTQATATLSDFELGTSLAPLQEATDQIFSTVSSSRPLLHRQARNQAHTLPKVENHFFRSPRIWYHLRSSGNHLTWLQDTQVDPVLALQYWQANPDKKLRPNSIKTTLTVNKQYYQAHHDLWEAICHGAHVSFEGGAV